MVKAAVSAVLAVFTAAFIAKQITLRMELNGVKEWKE